MCERYECKLSPELLKKAMAELNEPEDNDVRLAEIDKLRTRFQEKEKDLELIRTDDAFLLRFLRVKKFDQDRAYTMLVHYHTQRKEWREVFDLVDNPKKLERMLDAGAIMALPNQAKDGTFVVIGRPGRGLAEGDSMVMFVACLMLALEKLLENEEVQIRGLTVIEDMKEFGLSIAMQMASLGSKFIHTLQDCMPVRVKSVNMVNEGTVFDVIHAIVSKFMKDKMKSRLQLHGDVFDKLHEKIDPCYLPPFLGGTGPNLNAEAWKNEILSTLGEGEDTAL